VTKQNITLPFSTKKRQRRKSCVSEEREPGQPLFKISLSNFNAAWDSSDGERQTE